MTNPYLSPKEYVETLRTFEEPSGYRTQHTDMPEEEYVQAQLMGAVSSLEPLGAASQAWRLPARVCCKARTASTNRPMSRRLFRLWPVLLRACCLSPLKAF